MNLCHILPVKLRKIDLDLFILRCVGPVAVWRGIPSLLVYSSTLYGTHTVVAS